MKASIKDPPAWTYCNMVLFLLAFTLVLLVASAFVEAM